MLPEVRVGMPSPLHRKLQVIRRELWQRRLPHGLVSWRYLLPGADPRLRLHRRFWWLSGQRWPRPLWLAVEGWLWFRWVFWYGWRASWRVIGRFGSEIRAEQGISLKSQTWITLRLALGYCIPPRDIYLFQLYRAPGSALDYVYDQELIAYHAWRSMPLGRQTESLSCIQDKIALADRLREEDVPVVATYRVIAADSALSLDTALGERPQAFCKTRSGNQGRGAFAVWRTEQGLAGRALAGNVPLSMAETEAAWRALLALDDALIQPLLTNHPGLAPMSEGGEAITVRYISQWRDGELDCLCATMDIPAGKDDSGEMRYAIMPIDAATGMFQPLPVARRISGRMQAQTERVMDKAPPSRTIPGWSALAEASHRAHSQFPDVYAIAWDWVVTPEGPVLLEGNAGWGVVMPQTINGGFLAMTAN